MLAGLPLCRVSGRRAYLDDDETRARAVRACKVDIGLVRRNVEALDVALHGCAQREKSNGCLHGVSAIMSRVNLSLR